MWNLKHVESFVRLARNLHFGRTAEELGISQPALSVQIRSLEKEVGGPLFRRSSRRIELTPLGDVFLKDAKLMLALAARSRKNADEALLGRAARIAVGFDSSSVSSGLAVRAVAAARRESPSLYVECVEAPAASLPALLAKGEIDSLCGAFVDSPETSDISAKGFDTCLAFAAGRPEILEEAEKGIPLPELMPGEESIPAFEGIAAKPFPTAALSKLPLIRCSPIQSGPDGLEGLGLEARTEMRAASMRLVLELVDAGMGAAVIPAPDAALAGPRTALRPLLYANRLPFRFSLFAARMREGASREAQRFCEILAQEGKALRAARFAALEAAREAAKAKTAGAASADGMADGGAPSPASAQAAPAA